MYTQIFSATGETAAIDRTERRYAWLRKRLRAREDVWAVFPEAWRVQQHVCLLFCKVGRSEGFWGVAVRSPLHTRSREGAAESLQAAPTGAVQLQCAV